MTRVLKRVATYGRRGELVRVDETMDNGVKRYRVQWGSKGARAQESYPGTPAGRKAALAFAEGFATQASAPAKAENTWTTRALFDAYMVATTPNLRPRTIALYREHWRHWEAFFGRDTLANAMTADTPHEFRASLEAAGYATKTSQSIIETVRAVYNYAETTEKVSRNRWHQFRFKVAKDRRTQQRAEYRQSEFLAIWRQFDPTRADQWRGYVAVGLLGLYGMRQTATLHLAWDDVDEAAGTLTFRAAWDKQGETHVLPLLPMTRELLSVAKAWRERKGYTGPWLLFPGHAKNEDDTYTIQSLWSALQRAETAAGIDKIKWRGGHGFRRGLVGDLLASGNDMDLALKAIGDNDPRMARHYAVKRNERIEAALAARADSFAEGATKGRRGTETHENGAPAPTADTPLTADTSTTYR